MSKRILKRREFLQSLGTATAVVVAAASGAATILATNEAWAVELASLDAHQGEVLMRMTRQLYPHDMLGDVYYAEVVAAFDAKVKADPELAAAVKQGVADLDGTFGVPFMRLSPGLQIEALEKMRTGKFFQALRGHTVVALYNNKNVWPNFGYQGSSAEEGGYLFRGFQDAGWTMEPDAEASPPAYVG